MRNCAAETVALYKIHATLNLGLDSASPTLSSATKPNACAYKRIVEPPTPTRPA
ncbi:MAG: hypothetical protein IPJ98_26225 [Bryobacterales bacterium]|nr:hypothetical protein [Bryobacterales bacterium]